MLTEIAQRSHDISDIIAMLPGVETNTPGGVDVPNRNDIGQLTINGVSAAGSTMNITVDGGNTNLSGVGGYMNVVPTADMVKEIKVTSSNYRADTGMQSGPTISIVTKNGGKRYHGTAEFPYRDKIFNANLPDNKKIFPNTVRPNNLLVIPSVTFSGPLYIPHLIPKRADLFFFVGARYQRTSTATVQPDTLETAIVFISSTRLDPCRTPLAAIPCRDRLPVFSLRARPPTFLGATTRSSAAMAQPTPAIKFRRAASIRTARRS